MKFQQEEGEVQSRGRARGTGNFYCAKYKTGSREVKQRRRERRDKLLNVATAMATTADNLHSPFNNIIKYN